MNVRKSLLQSQAIARSVLELLGHPEPDGTSQGFIMMTTYNSSEDALLQMAEYAAHRNKDAVGLTLDPATHDLLAVTVFRTTGNLTLSVLAVGFGCRRTAPRR